MTFAAVLGRQLHFVSGKGGVGKSVTSCALALSFAARGHRTLLMQVNAADSHGALLGLPPIGPELQTAGKNLVVVNMTPAAALKEYALLTLKFEALYRTVFENRLTKSFMRFVPSLSELNLLGKIWFHAEEREHGAPKYARIVVDCPSTGHGLKLLRVASVVHEAARVGPMAEKTRLMAELIGDPARTALHVVALPEELPVNETLELLDQLARTRVAPPGGIILNQRLPTLFEGKTAQALPRLLAGDLHTLPTNLVALLDVAARRHQRETVELDQRARLAATGLPLVEFPQLWLPRLARGDVERFAHILGSAP